MAAPYREAPPLPVFPAQQIAWRRRVARSSGRLVVLVLVRWLVVSGLLGVGFEWTWALATLLDLAVLATTWTLTARAPHVGRVTWLAWLLRGAALICAASWPLAALGLPFGWAGPIGLLLLSATGLAYVAHVFDSLDLPRGARRARRVAVILAIAWSAFLLGASGGFAALSLAILCITMPIAFLTLRRLHKVLRVKTQDLWLDDNVTPAEWYALFELGDARAEVFSAAGRSGYFADRAEAEAWLLEQGLLPEAEAVARRLAPAPEA